MDESRLHLIGLLTTAATTGCVLLAGRCKLRRWKMSALVSRTSAVYHNEITPQAPSLIHRSRQLFSYADNRRLTDIELHGSDGQSSRLGGGFGLPNQQETGKPENELTFGRHVSLC